MLDGVCVNLRFLLGVKMEEEERECLLYSPLFFRNCREFESSEEGREEKYVSQRPLKMSAADDVI